MVKHVAAARSLKRERAKQTPEWFVNSKKKGHLVAAHLGARVPETYSADIASASIELKDNIVIKPTAGADAVGVFLVKDRTAIFDGRPRKCSPAKRNSGKELLRSWRVAK